MVLTSRTFRYLVAAVGIGILFLVCCTQADAQSPFWRPGPAPAPVSPPYSFTIEDENGNSLPTFVKDRRTFLLGEPGLRYNVRVQNPTGQRVEAVVSVDGRDAMSGQPGDYVNERGYVIPAYGSLLVEGFRKSFEEVAAFRFTSPEDSYSARMGTPQNVGVIGVAFFPERARPKAPVMRRPMPRPGPLPYDYYGYNRTRDRASEEPSTGAPTKRAPASRAPSEPRLDSEGRADNADRARREAKGATDSDLGSSGSVNNLGTQFGETRESVVTSVAFERALPTHPALVATLRYDDADGLTARGIDLAPFNYSRQGDDEPQAFPVSRFAQAPPR
jgi:hypothetical protein